MMQAHTQTCAQSSRSQDVCTRSCSQPICSKSVRPVANSSKLGGQVFRSAHIEKSSKISHTHRPARSQLTTCQSSRWQRETADCSAAMFGTLGLILGSTLIWMTSCHPSVAAEVDNSQLPTFHPLAADVQNLASNEDFWSNLARYGRYFVTVLLGTAYTAIRPFGGLLRQPVTAVFVLSFLVGLFFFLNATLKGMLGVSQEPLTLLDY